jgi:penicillin-binding protein 2
MGASDDQLATRRIFQLSLLDDGFLQPGKEPARNRPHGNLMVLRIAVLALFGILAVRLASMQLIDGADYAQRSRENHIFSTNILPTRGLIVDREGTPLVENVGRYAAGVTPELLPANKDQRYRIYLKLEELIGVPALEIQSKVQDAEDRDAAYIEILLQKNLSKERALMLDEASVDMPGVRLEVTPGRNYIAGDAFTHILGYIGAQSPEEFERLQKDGYNINEPVGKTGIESRYEKDLRGSVGVSQVEQDAQGRLITTLEAKDSSPGDSLKLAIDSGLQQYVYELLDAAKGEATVASAVVMSPKTGEVYAIVSLPSYDNNIYADPDTRSGELTQLNNDLRHPFLNQALTESAPGSTFKLLTASAALQEGNITTSTSINVASTILLIKGENGVAYPLYDWNAHGWINFYEAIAVSSNIFFYQASCGIPSSDQNPVKGLGQTYDNEVQAVTLAQYARAFGFGAPSGIDLEGEGSGIIPTPAWKLRSHVGPDFNEDDKYWYYSDTCFMGIGQGDVTATPIQIARMTAAIANGGKLLTPHVVNEVIAPDGSTVRKITADAKTVPVSAKNLAAVREGMHQSVQTARGAGIKARAQTIDVAGKTGTAEFGGYGPDGKRLQHAWFTGFAPFDDPEVVVTVYFDLGIGGDKAAPVAGQIFDYFNQNVKR